MLSGRHPGAALATGCGLTTRLSRLSWLPGLPRHTGLAAAGRLGALAGALALTWHLAGHLGPGAVGTLPVRRTAGALRAVTGHLPRLARLTGLLSAALTGGLASLRLPALLTASLSGCLSPVALLPLRGRLGGAAAGAAGALLTAGHRSGRARLPLGAGLTRPRARLLALLL